MMRSIVDSILDEDVEPLIPADAKPVNIKLLPNNSGIATDVKTPEEKLGVELALVAPYATPDWDKPIERKVAAAPKPTEDPTIKLITTSKTESCASVLNVRVLEGAPKATITKPVAPSFIRALDESGTIVEKPSVFEMLARGGTKQAAPAAPIQETVKPVLVTPSKSKEQIASELMVEGFEPVAIDPKVAAGKVANAFRGLFQ